MSVPAPSESASPPVQQQYDSANIAAVIAAVKELKHPAQIGPYVVDSLVGEGGMGLVYKAQQREPIQRTVAVKVIKLGMDTREVIARFESERQALALMDHPNVAKVLDAGATDGGRPYFVMEYVAGESITAYADRHQLTVRQRLELFAQACDAVQHAHQKAIIHRDLKPSNILVTQVDGKPQVKVIDFGVAKALSQRLTEKTLFTATGQLVGTPEYMAPEQAERTGGGDADTRNDVYSLGVVLYELLTGAVPFDTRSLRSAGYEEIQRIIREVDPPRPSTKLSSLGNTAQEIARRRQVTLEALSRQLGGELEWIPLKAMRKDRAQRYATCTELSEDVANYLANRPLRAGPESVWYRTRKFLRRNRSGVVASATTVLLLLAGISTTTWQAVRATRAEARSRADQSRAVQQQHEAERQRASADDARAAAQQVNAFLVGMLESADPEHAQGKAVLVRDVVNAAAKSVGKKFTGQPRVEAAVRSVLARTYLALGQFAQAEPHVDEAVAIYRRVEGDDDHDTLEALKLQANVWSKLGRDAEALKQLQDVLARTRRIVGERSLETAQVINDIAVSLQDTGKLKDAEVMFRNARDRYRALLGPDDPQSLKQSAALGQLLTDLGRYNEAEPMLREAYDGRRRTAGDNDPDTILTETDLAYVSRMRGALSQAETLFRDALDRSRKVYGQDHNRTMVAQGGLAIVMSDLGNHEEAVALFGDALARSRKQRGEDHPATLALLNSTATAMANAGRAAEAEPLLREALEKLTKRSGADHPQTLAALHALTRLLQRQAKWADSLPLAKDLYDRVRDAGRVQMDRQRRARCLAPYGIGLAELGRYEDAVGPLDEARQALGDTGDHNSETFRAVLKHLVDTNGKLNRRDEVARWTTELSAALAATQPSASAASKPATAPASH